jgi:hypothetical protein
MAKASVVEENFGDEIKQPSLSKGSISIFGHMINDQPLPSRGVSVNVKTGYPVKGGK